MAGLTAYFLLMLNAKYQEVFTIDFIYFSLTSLMLVSTVLGIFGMKDIVKDQINTQ